MSPTPIDPLARRAGEAVRDRADQLDDRRPHVDGLRRRDRIRRALTAGTAITVVVLVALVVVLVQDRPGSLPVIGDGTGTPPSERQPTEEPTEHGTPEPIGDRVRVADGVFEGSDEPWVLRAWLTESDGVCIQLRGTGCSALATEDDPLGAVGTGMTRGLENQGCVYGAIDEQVATVEVDFFDGETITLPSLDGQELPNDFYAYCWDGSRQPTSVRALDEQGRMLASADRP